MPKGEVWKKLLKQLGGTPRAHQEPERPPAPWRAVSVAPTRASCPAAVAIRDKRFLVAEAPTLPLPMCTWPLSCPCRLKVHEDRRVRPRRDKNGDAVKTRKGRQTGGRRTNET